ncbi:single-stranded-DNA-specific exonuclease RecJ [Candidatus Falkowbacteria bacterium CG11_big_fil_rev_8_21_14_0_20_39_10]|uniref:Single-stranded-DNA-specific exonuclease RecJ n=1 Tax=Candidatus Falkowbacteria bacterium CG11_big_fil_rev_8_21_14_0_20_39_10 TaxID=1974570 RepID=A0A2M6K992_9BACT|nr:MAG: single-stranded-DNA-specific exonuclease RecJ [Candidatus Falkowbacteria bacterium CG11_big_fil_rev_8_21_14_0_20_39_10]
MQKNWQVLPKITKDLIDKFPGYNQVVLQLLFNRGLTDEKDIKNFLNPDYKKDTHDPFLFQDMVRAVDLIIRHIKEQNKIVIYGDYDADGVTGSALLFEVLNTLKAKVDIYIPDRVKYGYGLNKECLEEILKDDVSLIITVDCGTRNHEEIKFIKSKNVDLIITDHHTGNLDGLGGVLFINPINKDENYPYKGLAGAGVSFKLAKALISRAKLDENVKQKLEEKILDLAAIGTVADCVSLLGENRVLVKKGLEVLNNTKRIGLYELMKVAQIGPTAARNQQISAWNIGFQIAPRLNAAGRMAHANTAFELLVTKDRAEARDLSQRLNDKNIERQKITEEIVEEIENQIKQTQQDKEKIIIAVSPEGKKWNEGVIGLVAGKICEKYYKPTLIITRAGDVYKSSARSIDEFDIIEAIEECQEFLTKFGGHPRAAGLTVKKENLEKFIDKFRRVANKKLKSVKFQPTLKIECEIDLKQADEDLIKELEKLEPFGQDNFRPNFVSKNVLIKDIMTMGTESQHVKFKINGMWALAFGRAKEWQNFKIGDMIDVVYYLEMNEFNGRREAQLKVIDIKKSTNYE